MIEVPDGFARSTVRREGEAGRLWIASLPAIVDELLQRWSRVPDGPVTHGSVGIVVPVRPAAVIKVSFPHPGNVDQPDAFAAWQGRGAVRILDRDDARFAMLLEQAGPDTLASVADDEQAVGILGQLSRRLTIPAPAGLPRLRDQFPAWEAEFVGSLPRRALDAVRELDHPDTLVHGDLWDANVLSGEREPWLAIDPKGCAGDPAYDAFTVIHSPRLLFAPDHLRWLHLYCEAAGIDRERARRWSLLRAVQSAQWGRRGGDPDWLLQATDQIIAELDAA
ncbi:aminoglycoside phosphotransferase family protein [Kutzneria sp. CA-103260]|uniref:aminoglycoside phosphotransferase family protein n=1 Tax=Kutzneria sp. CA-103260 TaxID=2802641 RepID=UPI001BA49425|nr:aminoglycoside phosphotransferase family protein [Kutzneria sp. CA-103260]QUQ71864.1 aminoglycoside phosphotransferase [Kutzneria sp. CA-103260]